MAIRVDIEALGEGEFVEIRDPKFLSWGLQKQITTIILEDINTAAQLDVAEVTVFMLSATLAAKALKIWEASSFAVIISPNLA